MIAPGSWAEASAPLRVCDAGGWTDTWFSGHGAVCNVAVGPGVIVRLEAMATDGLVELVVPAFGDRYAFAVSAPPGRHPLLEATVRRWAPRGTGLRVEVRSAAPHGLGAGGSAAVVVALVGALRGLAGEQLDVDDVARAAFEVETVELGWQSGVQDQLACAHGGASLLEMPQYPHATVQPLALAEATWHGLGERLVTVYLGRPHRSSSVHDHVIARFERDASTRSALEPLRRAAYDAAAALVGGDLDAYGAVLAESTVAQAALDDRLVCADARAVIDVARRCGAAGWKVNGAGGDGGSVTVLSSPDPAELVAELGRRPNFVVLPLRPARSGLTVQLG